MNEMNGVGLMHLLEFVRRQPSDWDATLKSSGEAISSGRTMLAILYDS